MFYDVYKKLCDNAGKSPSAVALEIGISKSAVSTWKNLGRTPKMEQLTQVAGYFGVSTDYLLEKEEKPSGNTAEGREIGFDDFTYAMHDESKELTEENKKKLLELARFFKEQQDKEENG